MPYSVDATLGTLSNLALHYVLADLLLLARGQTLVLALILILLFGAPVETKVICVVCGQFSIENLG